MTGEGMQGQLIFFLPDQNSISLVIQRNTHFGIKKKKAHAIFLYYLHKQVQLPQSFLILYF